MDKRIGKKEQKRLQQLIQFEELAYAKGFHCVVGLDEAGRGPLAGPVVASVCYIPKGILIPYINDSKQLTPIMRRQLFMQLVNDPDIHYGIGIVDHGEIDRINIHQATFQAMFMALEQLTAVKPDYLLIDGFKLPHPSLPSEKIIKGDTLSQSIAAASIIAKETRDELMMQYDLQFPEYGFRDHKGYGTERHLKAIEEFGPCAIHRLTYEPVKSQRLIKC